MRKTVIVLLLFICSAICWYLLFFPDIARLVIHSPNTLFKRFGTTALYTGFIPSDTMPVFSTQKKMECFDSVQDFQIVKDGATDCSFVAAVMLLLRRDPLFLSRVIRKEADGTYNVMYSTMDQFVTVTRKDLTEFHESWKSTRTWYNTFFSGYLPVTLSILRCAYYRYQANTGIRCCQGTVHSGGVPLYDLMVLSGATNGITVQAFKKENTEKVNFKSCTSVIIETRVIKKQDYFEVNVRNMGVHVSNPIEMLDKPNEFLIVLSSVTKIPWYLKHKFVPNHAYYFLGQDGPDRYVLGDSYNTCRPVRVSGQELGEYFRSMDFISLSGSKIPR